MLDSIKNILCTQTKFLHNTQSVLNSHKKNVQKNSNFTSVEIKLRYLPPHKYVLDPYNLA